MAINKLLFTGLFGKNNKISDTKELNIKGDCTITNYDTRTNVVPEAYVKARTYKNSVFLEEGAKTDKSPNVADFSAKKANILEEISKLDTTDDGLSKKDILKIDQYNKGDYIKKWGLKDLAVDHKNGVLTVKWGENDILRIDFSPKTNSEAPQKGTEVQQKNADISMAEVKSEQSQKQEKPSRYIVKKGDTLYSIAKRFGLTVGALKEMNPGLTNTIKVGQEIKLAVEKKKKEAEQVQAQTSKQEIPITYKVQRGDTLSQIAQKFGLTVDKIVSMNKGLKRDNIQVGQVITLRVEKNYNKVKKDSLAFLQSLGEQETRGVKNPYACKNKYGYVGRYQMGEQAMVAMGIYKKKPDPKTKKVVYNNDWSGIFKKNKYGITSLWDYRRSPEKQDALQMDYKKQDWKYIKNLGLDKYVGREINGQLITASGLLAGAHLVGVGGLKKYLNSNGKNDVKDATGTPVSLYIKRFSGYDVSKITG